MAASIGTHGVAFYGGDALPRPSAVVMAYTAHSELSSNEPPTFVVVGEQDGIAPPYVMERRISALRSAGSLVLAIRTARWSPTTSDGLAHVEWEKEVEHSVRISRLVLSHLTTRYPDLFQSKQVPWYVATDEDSPK